MVQWLGLHTSTARDTGLIPGQGTKTLQAARHSLKKTQRNKNKKTNKKGHKMESLILSPKYLRVKTRVNLEF